MDKLNYNVIFWASELVLVDAVVGRSGVETGRRLICRGGTSMYHFGRLHHIVPDQNKTNRTRPPYGPKQRQPSRSSPIVHSIAVLIMLNCYPVTANTRGG